MSYTKPPEGTKIAIKPMDGGVFVQLTCPAEYGQTVHLFDITHEWEYWMEEVMGAREVLSGGAETNPAENEPNYAKLDRLAAEFIERRLPRAAEAALDGFLKEITEGPDECVMDGLRVYQALWSRLQELKSEIASQN